MLKDQTPEWEKEFDNIFVTSVHGALVYNTSKNGYEAKTGVKAFIRQVRQRVMEETIFNCLYVVESSDDCYCENGICNGSCRSQRDDIAKEIKTLANKYGVK